MKIRTGFVSNSSSASFVLRIDLPFDQVMKNLAEDFWHYSASGVEDGIYHTIENEKTIINDYSKNLEKDDLMSDLNKIWLKDCKETLARFEELKEKSKHSTSEIALMNYLAIVKHVRVTSEIDKTLVTGYTSMFNGYEDIPEAMADIIVSCALRHVNTNLEVDHED